MRHQGLHVVEQRRGDMDLLHRLLQLVQILGREHRVQGIHQIAPVDAAQQFPFRRRRGVSQVNPHQKPVELRLGQGKSADLVLRVLRGDHEEGFGQRHGLAVQGHLPLLHGFEQRALRFGRCAVDFIRQHQLREDRATLKAELAGVAIEDRDAEDIGRQKIAGELHALEG